MTSARDPVDQITFAIDGPVDDDARRRAEDMVERLIDKAPRPVLFARVKLRVEPQRPAEEQALAQGTIDVSGALVRAEAAAPSPAEAVDLLGDRLDRRLRRLAERREAAAERPPSTPPGQWRRGDLPDTRPGYFPRPREERRVLRRKSYAPEESSIEEAVFHLDVLDYRFFLFTDQSDGVDAVVYETDEGPVLRRITADAPPVERDLPVRIETTPVPELSTNEAVARLDLSDEPFVFYRDASSGRAAALYRRYDGHYGLVTPA
jgi:ribosome-associated translation inhibitor RaiA